MKEFRKKDDLFICEECSQVFRKKDKLVYHINKKHNGAQSYYDKWLKEDNEGLCIICENETEFTGFKYAYKKTCSKECLHKYQSLSSHNFFENINEIEKNKIKQKQKNSWAKKTQEERHLIRQKIENTCFNNYGVLNNMNLDFVKEKLKDTNLQKYGVDNPSKNKIIKEKRKKTLQKTLLAKYGVINVSQNKELFEKSQKKQLKLHKFRDTNINYQSSYELDFLEKYYNKYPDIERGPSIKYFYKNKQHYYHSDFFIPSINTVIEIKNRNLFEKDKEKIYQKQIYTINEGYNYIIIIDKNYTNINL